MAKKFGFLLLLDTLVALERLVDATQLAAQLLGLLEHQSQILAWRVQQCVGASLDQLRGRLAVALVHRLVVCRTFGAAKHGWALNVVLALLAASRASAVERLALAKVGPLAHAVARTTLHALFRHLARFRLLLATDGGAFGTLVFGGLLNVVGRDLGSVGAVALGLLALGRGRPVSDAGLRGALDERDFALAVLHRLVFTNAVLTTVSGGFGDGKDTVLDTGGGSTSVLGLALGPFLVGSDAIDGAVHVLSLAGKRALVLVLRAARVAAISSSLGHGKDVLAQTFLGIALGVDALSESPGTFAVLRGAGGHGRSVAVIAVDLVVGKGAILATMCGFNLDDVGALSGSGRRRAFSLAGARSILSPLSLAIHGARHDNGAFASVLAHGIGDTFTFLSAVSSVLSNLKG